MENLFKWVEQKQVLFLAFSMIAGGSVAQPLPAGSLQQQFISYQAHNYNEKIFVHTDKAIYVAGESIWFKIYCVDECFHKPSPVSKIAYIEIISKENKPILQAKIAMVEGIGNGSFIIPSFVASGNYKIRSYTAWMKNFDAGYFFEESLTIINTIKTSALQEEKEQKYYDISFFPEGGNLVEGITSKVAFKAVDEHGEPVDCKGSIADSHSNTITSFQSFKFGMGSFTFMPKPGETYKAVIQFPDTILVKQLLLAYQQGFVMHVENADDSHIRIVVSANVPGGNAVYLLIHSQNMIKDFQQSKLAGAETVFIIDKTKLPDGISNFTIFNSEKQPVCERPYFKRPLSPLVIQIQPDRYVYEPRKPVNISLSATGNLNMPVMANMSVSVFMIDSLQHAAYTDILSYLLLSSELQGNITSPDYYFQNSKEADETANNLMLTQGWRRFKWEEILQNKMPYFEFIPEYEGFIINGKITGRQNDLPAKNIGTVLTVPGENFRLTNTNSDESGNLQFNIKKFYGSGNLIIKADSIYKTDIMSSYADKFSTDPFPVFKMPLRWTDQLLFRSINVQAENAYLVEKKQRTLLYDTEDTSLFYGKPDKRYYLDDYTRFITMEEVMREYVTEVQVRKESQQFHFRTYNNLLKEYFADEPLILLDGLPVANANAIMELDPLKIKRLDVIAHKYYYGNIVTNGIVSYTTYKGNLAGFPLDAGAVVIKFDGLQREREFYSPAYKSTEETASHLPDTRNVLYWSPEISTGMNGKANFNFYTSDLTGKFACVVQGITSDGLAGSNIITFSVIK